MVGVAFVEQSQDVVIDTLGLLQIASFARRRGILSRSRLSLKRGRLNGFVMVAVPKVTTRQHELPAKKLHHFAIARNHRQAGSVDFERSVYLMTSP